MLQVALNPLVKPEIEKHQYVRITSKNIAKVRQVSLEENWSHLETTWDEKHALEEILMKLGSRSI